MGLAVGPFAPTKKLPFKLLFYWEIALNATGFSFEKIFERILNKVEMKEVSVDVGETFLDKQHQVIQSLIQVTQVTSNSFAVRQL